MTRTLHFADGGTVDIEIVPLSGGWSDCEEVVVPDVGRWPFPKPADVGVIARKLQKVMNKEIIEAALKPEPIDIELALSEDGELVFDESTRAPAVVALAREEAEQALATLGRLAGRKAEIRARMNGYVSRLALLVSVIDRVERYINWKYERVFQMLSDSEGKGKTKRVTLDHGEVWQSTPARGKWEIEKGQEQAAAVALFKSGDAGLKAAVAMAPQIRVSELSPEWGELVERVTNGAVRYVPPTTSLKTKVTGQEKTNEDE